MVAWLLRLAVALQTVVHGLLIRRMDDTSCVTYSAVRHRRSQTRKGCRREGLAPHEKSQEGLRRGTKPANRQPSPDRGAHVP